MNILIPIASLISVIARFHMSGTIQCGNDSSAMSKPPTVQSLEEEIQWSREYEYKPIRIGLYYYQVDLGSEADLEYFKTHIIASVIDYFSKVLLVKRLNQNLLIQTEECSDFVQVPEQHKTNGIPDTDLVIYITSDDRPDEVVVASAGACYLQGGGANNVLAGAVSINTPVYHQVNEEMKIAVIAHEITHILGFGVGLFEFFNKPNGDKYYKDEILISREIRGDTRYLVKSPTVVEEARRVFNCEELEGLELENNTKDGSAGSHWDQRLAFHDYMAAQVVPDNFYTTFTFALLKDSGWYEIDWTYVHQPGFGAGKGCDFINNKCLENSQQQFQEFCSSVEDRCDLFRLHKGFCDLVVLEDPLTSPYTYFKDPYIGGKGKYRDFCPVIREYDEGSCRGSGKLETKTNDLYGEIVCPNCRCLEGTLIREEVKKSDTPFHTGCYEVLECFSDRADIRVGNEVFGYQTVSCSFDKGEKVEVEGYRGYLECPSSDILCGHVPCIRNCSGKGKCERGKCVCDWGWGGDSCSIECSGECKSCTGSSKDECLSCWGENKIVNKDGSCGCRVSFREVEGECVCLNGTIGEDGECYENCGSLCLDCDILNEDCLVCKKKIRKNDTVNASA